MNQYTYRIRIPASISDEVLDELLSEEYIKLEKEEPADSQYTDYAITVEGTQSQSEEFSRLVQRTTGSKILTSP